MTGHDGGSAATPRPARGRRPQRTVATALEIESWTHSNPLSRNLVGTTRWLPVTSLANSPSTARSAKPGTGTTVGRPS